ncbi:MAG: hypothetical protein WAK82_27860 [Streptosporangiaceae bacterium]
MNAAGDRDFGAHATLVDGRRLSNTDVRDAELIRARHALAYLTAKLGTDSMLPLLADDLDRTASEVHGWVAASAGEWQTGTLELVIEGLKAQAFQDWYAETVMHDRQPVLRAGHPEHFVNHRVPDDIEVVENIGETELPWHIRYHALPEDGDFPIAWDPGYPVRYGMAILMDNATVGYSMRQSRDTPDGMELLLTTFLPAAGPAGLAARHLHHFAIEFRNWTRLALADLHETRRGDADGED